MQKLQAADARRATQHSEGKADAQVLLNQVKTLEENARQDAKERVTKGDMALVHKDMELLRKDMEAMEQRLDARFDALQNSLIIKLGGMMVLVLGAGAALVKMLS